MLQGMTWASPPASLIPSAASLQASALRDEITTLAPSFANSSAEERPMPRLEPVMMATFPVRSNGVFFIVVDSLNLARHSGMRRKAQTRNPEVVGARFSDAQLRIVVRADARPGMTEGVKPTRPRR